MQSLTRIKNNSNRWNSSIFALKSRDCINSVSIIQREMKELKVEYKKLMIEAYFENIGYRGLDGQAQKLCYEFLQSHPKCDLMNGLFVDMILDSGVTTKTKEHLINHVFTFASMNENNAKILYKAGVVAEAINDIQKALDFYLRSMAIDKSLIAPRFRVWCIGKIHNKDNLVSLGEPNFFEPVIPSFTLEKIKTFNEVDILKFEKAKNTTGVIVKEIFDDNTISELHKCFNLECEKRMIRQKYVSKIEQCSTEMINLTSILVANLSNKLLKHISTNLIAGWEPILNPAVHAQFSIPTNNPTNLHQDRPSFTEKNDWSTFWIPCTENGTLTHPGLEVIPLYIGAMPLKNGNFSTATCPVSRELLEEYFAKSFIQISVPICGLFIFGPHVFHRGISPAGALKNRFSIDFRIEIGPRSGLI